MNVYAQSGYTVKHYTSENGLPQNSVKSIVADSDGFIWLATEDGLVRFDGRHFYVFNSSNLGIRGNRSNDIMPYFRDVNTSKVLSHNGRSSVSHVYFEHQEAVRIENGKAVKDTVVNQYIERRMLGVNKRGKVIYIHGMPTWNYISNAKALRYLFGSGNNRGDFYVSDSTGVNYYLDFKQQYHIPVRVPKIWTYFSLGERLYYFHDQKYFTQIFNNKITQFVLSGDILHDPAYDAAGATIKLHWNNNSDQAFLSTNQNIYALEPQEGGKLVTRLILEGFDATTAGIEMILADKLTGNVFLGSVTNGLYVVTKKQFRALNVQGNNMANVFYAQLPGQNGTVITPTGIRLGLNALTNRISDSRLRFLEKANIDDKRGMLRDKNGAIWVKSYSALVHIDKESTKILGKWGLNGEIKSMCQGKDGLIWIAATDNRLYSVNPDRPEKGMHMELDSFPVVTFLESPDPEHLLAGTASGLYRINLLSKKIQLIKGTKNLYIKSIHVNSQNRIWLTVQEKGLMLMNGQGGLIAFPIDKNKYLASAHCVVDDGNGYLWVPTNKGLFQTAINDLLSYAKLKESVNKHGTGTTDPIKLPTELFYAYHTMEEGFNTNEFNGSCQPCGLMLSNEFVSLPSLNGLVWFMPKKVSAHEPKGKIVLDGADIKGKALLVAGDSIHFPFDPENIRLRFTTAYFGNDYNLNLSYALVKRNETVKESGWIPIDNSDFSVRYSSLNAGNYTLLVRKKNGFGINNYSVKKIFLIVPERWYETFWAEFVFITAFIFFLIISVYLYNTHRLKAIERENKRLEEIIEKRTESLNNALDRVEESKDEMEQQMHIFSRLVASISHDVQSPLRYIAFASQKIPQMVEMNQLEKASKLGTTIFDLSDRMNTMLMDLLDFIKVTVYGKRMHFENVSVKKLVDAKLELFKSLVDRNDSYFINDVPSEQKVFSDRQFLSIVIHNLIDNAAKYTYNGQVRIYMGSATDHEAELIISNTGRGIPLEMIEMMNAPIEDKSLDDLMESGSVTGLGLLIVKEMGKLAGVTIKVTQTDVTSFHLLFGREA